MVEQIFDHLAPDGSLAPDPPGRARAGQRWAALMFIAGTGPLDSAPMIGLLFSL
jgi:hypothetical protein